MIRAAVRIAPGRRRGARFHPRAPAGDNCSRATHGSPSWRDCACSPLIQTELLSANPIPSCGSPQPRPRRTLNRLQGTVPGTGSAKGFRAGEDAFRMKGVVRAGKSVSPGHPPCYAGTPCGEDPSPDAVLRFEVRSGDSVPGPRTLRVSVRPAAPRAY